MTAHGEADTGTQSLIPGTAPCRRKLANVGCGEDFAQPGLGLAGRMDAARAPGVLRQ